MNLFAIYLVMLFLTVVPYLLFKTQFRNWCAVDAERFNEYTSLQTDDVTEKKPIATNKPVEHSDFILRKSLSYLEYSSAFESYIESTDTTKLSPEFLQEFEAHKRKIQREVLNTTDSLQNNYSQVA